MAIEATNKEDEQKVQQGFGATPQAQAQQNQTQSVTPTLGGAQSSTLGQDVGQAQNQQQTSPGQASTGQKGSGMGARLSNLKKYIETNRGSGMAQKIQGGIEGIRSGVQQGIGQSQAKLQEQTAAEKARIARGETLIQGSQAGGGGVFEKGRSEAYTQDITPNQTQTPAPDYSQYGKTTQERLAEFGKYRTGEVSQFDVENQAQLEQQAKELQKRADLSQSEAGRYQLLRETFNRPAYTTGQQRLDQLLLQADPTESAQLATMAKTVNAPVQEQLKALQAQKESQNAALKTQAQALAGKIGTGLTEAQTEFTTDLQKAQEAAKVQTQQAYSQLQDKMARGEPITQDDLEKLTATSSDQNVKDFLDYYQRGVKQTIGEKLQSGVQFTPQEQAKVATQVAPKLGLTPDQYNEIKNRQPMSLEQFAENNGKFVENGQIMEWYDYFGPDAAGDYSTQYAKRPATDTINKYNNYTNSINQQKQQLDQLTSEAIQAFPDIANFRSLSDIDYSQYLRGAVTPELAQVASQEDYARQAALEALTAQGFGPLDQANLAQAGTYGQQDVGKFGLEQALGYAREFYNKPEYQSMARVGVAETPYSYTPLEGLAKASSDVGTAVEGVTNLNAGQALGGTASALGNAAKGLVVSPLADVEHFLTGGSTIKSMENSISDMGKKVGGVVGTFWCSQVYKKGLVGKSEMKELRKFLIRIIPTHARFLSWYIDNGQRIADLANQKGFDWNEGKILLFDELLSLYRIGHIEGAVKCYDEFTVKICEFIGEKPPVECRKSGLLDSLKFLPKVIKFYWSK